MFGFGSQPQPQPQPALNFPNFELKSTFSSLPQEIQNFFSEKHTSFHSILDISLDKITSDANRNAELCSSISQLLVAIKTKLPKEKQLLNQVQMKLNFIEKEVRAQLQIANWLRVANSHISQVDAYFNREEKSISSSAATIREILSDFDKQIEDYQLKIKELEEYFQTAANNDQIPSTSFLSEVLSAQKEAFFLLSSKVSEIHEKVETIKNRSNLKIVNKLDFTLPPVEPYQNTIPVNPTPAPASSNIFGTPSTSTPSSSLFGNPATPSSSSTSLFGTPSATSTPSTSLFGGGGFGTTSPTSNPFGSSTTTSNPFGTPSTSSNPFGTTASASNPFASSSSSSTNPFASSNPFAK